MRLWAFFYRRGIFKSHRLPVPVISVGNLTLGGTGKTPCVMEVARLLLALGRRPAVVSRGYHGQARGAVNIVSDGRQVLLDVRLAGDEPYLLAKSLPGVPVLTGVKRAVVGSYAIDQLNADIIILDDGFQHLALHRDLDLVLFKAPDFLGNARVFPGGRLREPVSALSRAHAFILTGIAERDQEETERFSRFLQGRFPGRPVFKTAYIADCLIGRAGKGQTDLNEARSLKFCAFCGLAHPESFSSTLAGEGLQVADFKAFADHYAYTPQDMTALVAWAKDYGAEALVTTEKDLVKLKDCTLDFPVFALRVRFDPGEELRRFLSASLNGPKML